MSDINTLCHQRPCDVALSADINKGETLEIVQKLHSPRGAHTLIFYILEAELMSTAILFKYGCHYNILYMLILV